MSSNHRAKQSLSERLTRVLMRYAHETGDTHYHELAEAIGETSRDLKRWAGGVGLPGYVLSLLLGALPEHLASMLIAPTGRKLVDQEMADSANALSAASAMSKLSSDIAAYHADGHFDHRERAMTSDQARQVLPEIERLARMGEE